MIHTEYSKEFQSIAEALTLQAIKDYSKYYVKVLRDPQDSDAKALMQKMEDFIVTEPLVQELISDTLELLFKIDLRIEAEHARRAICH